MSLEQLLNSLPDYARDIKINMSSVLRQTELTEQQTWGTAVACAMAARNLELMAALTAEAAPRLNAQAMQAAKAAAAIMGMNNVFYRFRHFAAANEKYAAIPARLRMQAIRSHGSDPVDFELLCLAVSSINGCQACVEAHEKVLREKGIGEESIVAAVRIAATVHALAGVLDAETQALTAAG